MNEVIGEEETLEATYTIIPSKVNINDLFFYLTQEVSFKKILTLYIKLRVAISTGDLGSDKE